MPWRVGRNDKECFRAVNEPDEDTDRPSYIAEEQDLHPGQLLHPHVYINKVLEHLLAHPEKCRGLEDRLDAVTSPTGPDGAIELRWSARRLGAMGTEEILQSLARLGNPLEPEEFRRLARGRTSAIDLADECLRVTHDIPAPYDGDFVWMASLELWRRLVRRPCVEMLEEELIDGYLALDDGRCPEAVAHWEAAWRLLKRAVPARIGSIEAAEEHLTGCPARRLPRWCDDLCGELVDATGEDRACASRLLAFSSGFLTRFPGSDRGIILFMRTSVAEAHAMLGHRREADEAYGALARDDPGDVPTYLLWGDSLWRPPAVRRMDSTVRDRARAKELYEKALRLGGPLEDVLRERLRELEEYDDRGYS